MTRFLPLFLILGCMEYQIDKRDEESALSGISVEVPDPASEDGSGDSSTGSSSSSGSSDSSGSSGSNNSSNSTGSSGSGSSGSGSSGSSGGASESDPGSSSDVPRAATRGDVIINELMIDPESSSDSEGEWVELWNISDDWVDLTGAHLADDGVDDYEIEPEWTDALVVGPGEYLIICVDSDWWSNGGVDCDGTVLYQTYGGGFALSNTEDEVILIAESGTTLDTVRYGINFAEVGASMGVDPDAASVSGNDDLDDWCDQWDSLAFGDGGSPGRENDWCW